MPDPTIITTGGKARVPTATQLLSTAFSTDPVITYMLSSMAPAPRAAYRPDYIATLLTAAALNAASFDEAAGWLACGVLMPPRKRVDNPLTLLPAGLLGLAWNVGLKGCQRMLFEFTPLVDASKAKALHSRKEYYYVFFVGTLPAERRKGLCSAIIKEYQARAAKDGLPLWLEATTAYSMRIYLKLGFRIVDEIVLGKGRANADGTECEGGEGVKIWGMIWEPEIMESTLNS